MNRPFAITLDVGTSRANHTGTWRTERPVYRVGINSVERFLGDEAIRRGWPVFASGAPVDAAPTGKPSITPERT